MTGASDEAIGAYGFRVWSYKQGELVSTLIHLGSRLGLFAALREVGPDAGAAAVAEACGLDQRWVLEWLRGVAAADLVHSADGETFSLPPEAEAVLLEPDHLAFAAPAFSGGRPAGFVDRLADAFRTGVGPSYDDQGQQGAHETAGCSGAWSRSGLVPLLFPAVDGLVERLRSGTPVLDVGCGAGEAVAAVAEAFPASHVVGVDLSRFATELAAERVAEVPNAEIRLGRAEEVADEGGPDGAGYGLVLTLDVLHDLTRPADAAAEVRSVIAEDGVWLIKEIRAWPTWEQNRKNPMLAMFYGFSIAGCLGSGTSEPGGAGLGTCGLHGERLAELVTEAGFGSIRTHDIGDPANLYYEVRP